MYTLMLGHTVYSLSGCMQMCLNIPAMTRMLVTDTPFPSTRRLSSRLLWHWICSGPHSPCMHASLFGVLHGILMSTSQWLEAKHFFFFSRVVSEIYQYVVNAKTGWHQQPELSLSLRRCYQLNTFFSSIFSECLVIL